MADGLPGDATVFYSEKDMLERADESYCEEMGRSGERMSLGMWMNPEYVRAYRVGRDGNGPREKPQPPAPLEDDIEKYGPMCFFSASNPKEGWCPYCRKRWDVAENVHFPEFVLPESGICPDCGLTILTIDNWDKERPKAIAKMRKRNKDC